MWLNSTTTTISCNLNTELSALGSAPPNPATPAVQPPHTGTHSSWGNSIAKLPMNIQMPLLHAAIVRTSVSGHRVSLASAGATGALASGMAHYLQSSGADLLLVPEYHELKDFIGTAFTGVLGAGMAFLRMMEDGYWWHAHYEESLATSLSSKIEQPDFVFVKSGSVAIVESKGTGEDVKKALSAAQNGFVRQVYPAFGRKLGAGGYPTEGYAFGTSIGTATVPHRPIEMASAFEVRTPVPPSSSVSSAVPSITASTAFMQVEAIKRLNYQKAARQMGLIQDTQTNVDQRGSLDVPTEGAVPWEDTLDVDNLADGKNDIQLSFGPPLAVFEQNGQIYSARVAMTFGLLRRLKNRDYPRDNSDTNVEDLLVNGNSKGYWFVNFPDEVKVVYTPIIWKDGALQWS